VTGPPGSSPASRSLRSPEPSSALTRRRRRQALVALGTASFLAFGAAACGVPSQHTPDAGEDASLGPTIVHTGTGPSGYEVTLRYAAHEAEAVGLVGDVFFTQPEAIGPDLSHEARLGDEWQPGDVSMPLMVAPPVPLTRAADGVWEITFALPAGTYSYGFVEGECRIALVCTSSPDPANSPVLSGAAAASAQHLSQVHVPVDPDFPTYEATYELPLDSASGRGEVSLVTYAGALDGVERPLGVYLPSGYDPARAEPYPLLVLSHGAGGNETTWFSEGAAANILDHAIADGAIPPVVAITTDFSSLGDAAMDTDEFYADYRVELIDGVLPFVERELNVATTGEGRAFGGLSMGGALGLSLLRTEPALFDWWGLWSAAADLGESQPAPLTDAQLAEGAHVQGVHMGTGRQDYLEGIGALSMARADVFAAQGMPVTTFDIDGGHAWQVWRAELNDYLRRVAFPDHAE